eukprot:scaffold20471_cov111-Isochrysis_galbana.AAC.2
MHQPLHPHALPRQRLNQHLDGSELGKRHPRGRGGPLGRRALGDGVTEQKKAVVFVQAVDERPV